MTHTVFTLLNWAFVDTGITISDNSVVTLNAAIFSKCFTEPPWFFLPAAKSSGD
jgi:hypothetical protein